MCLPIVLFSVISNLGKPNYLYASGAIGQIFSYSKLIESIVFPFDTGNLYLSLIFLLLVGYIFISWLIVNKNNLNFSLIVGFFVLPITVIILMSFAYASNHDYYPKYMLPSLGILFTTISIILVDLKYNKIFIFLIILINLFSYSNIFIIENKSKHEFKKLEEFTNDFINNNETIIFNFDYGMYIVDYYQFEGFKSNEFIWDTNYIEKENSLYFIQTDKLNDYFIDGTDEIVDYHIIESFEIRFDKFSLCKVNIQ